ncbi:hypothetical protein PO909_014146 [Leuciscus waleckii]
MSFVFYSLLVLRLSSFFFSTIHQQDQQEKEQRLREAEEWKIQQFWKERENERGMESVIEQTREKERVKDTLHDRERETEMLKVKERQRLDQQPSSNEKNLKGNRGLDREEEDWRNGLSISPEEESRKQRELEELQHKTRNLETQANQEECAEEERQRKEQLLLKMHQIDMQTQGQDSDFFSDDTGSVRSPLRLSEKRNHNGIFKFTEPEENTNTFGSGRRGGGHRAQGPSADLDLSFGSYAPSFGKSASRTGLGTRNSNQSPREADEGLDLSGLVKERKSNLMQQLFGATATPPPSDPSSKMEILNPPLTTQFPSGPVNGRRRDSDTPNGLNISSLPNNRSTLQVSESRPMEISDCLLLSAACFQRYMCVVKHTNRFEEWRLSVDRTDQWTKTRVESEVCIILTCYYQRNSGSRFNDENEHKRRAVTRGSGGQRRHQSY